jgi:hypothetical protein
VNKAQISEMCDGVLKRLSSAKKILVDTDFAMGHVNPVAFYGKRMTNAVDDLNNAMQTIESFKTQVQLEEK